MANLAENKVIGLVVNGSCRDPVATPIDASKALKAQTISIF
jgi:hypothetical protein